MKAIIALGLLILVAFLGSQFLFRRRVPLAISYFFLSGIVYIFLGLFLGKKGLNVLSPDVLEGFSPLINLGLGWIGFLFGFQLEYKYLRRFPLKYLGLSFLQSLFIIGFVSAVLVLALHFLFPSQPSFVLYGMACALGLLLSLNSPSLLNLFSAQAIQKGRYYHLARFLVSVSGFWGIGGLALVTSFLHFPSFRDNLFSKGVLFLLASTILPLFIGYLFHFLTIKKIPEDDLLVFLLGTVFLTSGAAAYFNFPSLYVCMVLGITFSNLTRIQEKLYPLFLSTEKAFYIIFLILVGALWELNFNLKLALLIIILPLLRVIGYSLSLSFFSRTLRFPFHLPARFGLCFLSSGGVAVAFIVCVRMVYPHPFSGVFVSVAIMATAASEILSPWVLKSSLLSLDSEK
jgi:hypothetical protein